MITKHSHSTVYVTDQEMGEDFTLALVTEQEKI